MQFSEVEVRSLSQENAGLGFVSIPDTIPAQFRQRCLEHRHAAMTAPRPTRKQKPAPAKPAVSDDREQLARRLQLATL
jgi:hypothetical protein